MFKTDIKIPSLSTDIDVECPSCKGKIKFKIEPGKTTAPKKCPKCGGAIKIQK